MPFDLIRERLLRLDTACVSDANKALSVMDPGIRPVHLGMKLIGRAHTVICEEDFLTVIQALRDALPGEVLVIDTHGSRRAVAGELFATEAARKGLAGIVVDGAVRDTAKIRSLTIPVYSRTLNHFTAEIAETAKRALDARKTGKARTIEIFFCVLCALCGVTVRFGANVPERHSHTGLPWSSQEQSGAADLWPRSVSERSGGSSTRMPSTPAS